MVWNLFSIKLEMPLYQDHHPSKDKPQPRPMAPAQARLAQWWENSTVHRQQTQVLFYCQLPAAQARHNLSSPVPHLWPGRQVNTDSLV
jgi:hypothetical protein